MGKRALGNVLFFLICGSVFLQNTTFPFNNNNPIIIALNYFNLAPYNWSMFTHTFKVAYERQFIFHMSDGTEKRHPIKGLYYPWRRSVINELEERILTDAVQGFSGISKPYLDMLCKTPQNSESIITKIAAYQRYIPLSAIIAKEQLDVFRYNHPAVWKCS